jgi:Phage integrase, N-terminal SAM-like domain
MGPTSRKADLSATTHERYQGIITKHIRPRWGEVQLAAIRHANI